MRVHNLSLDKLVTQILSSFKRRMISILPFTTNVYCYPFRLLNILYHYIMLLNTLGFLRKISAAVMR